MTDIAAIISTLRSELDDTVGKASSKKSRKKKPAGDGQASLFEPSHKKGRSKVRVVAEIDARLGRRFKDICRRKDWHQKDLLERFIQSFVEHHSS